MLAVQRTLDSGGWLACQLEAKHKIIFPMEPLWVEDSLLKSLSTCTVRHQNKPTQSVLLHKANQRGIAVHLMLRHRALVSCVFLGLLPSSFHITSQGNSLPYVLLQACVTGAVSHHRTSHNCVCIRDVENFTSSIAIL